MGQVHACHRALQASRSPADSSMHGCSYSAHFLLATRRYKQVAHQPIAACMDARQCSPSSCRRALQAARLASRSPTNSSLHRCSCTAAHLAGDHDPRLPADEHLLAPPLPQVKTAHLAVLPTAAAAETGALCTQALSTAWLHFGVCPGADRQRLLHHTLQHTPYHLHACSSRGKAILKLCCSPYGAVQTGCTSRL